MKHQNEIKQIAVIDFSEIKQAPDWIPSCFEEAFGQYKMMYRSYIVGLGEKMTKIIWDRVWDVEKRVALREMISQMANVWGIMRRHSTGVD